MKRDKTIHNKSYSNLIEKLRLERKCLGLSQVEVAERLNLTQSEMSKLESGDRRMDIVEFKEILRVYRINENSKLNGL